MNKKKEPQSVNSGVPFGSSYLTGRFVLTVIAELS